MAWKKAEMLLILLLLNYTGVILKSQCSEADKYLEITRMESVSVQVRFYLVIRMSLVIVVIKKKTQLVNSV